MRLTKCLSGEAVRPEGGAVEAGHGVAERGEGTADLAVAALGHSDAVDVGRWVSRLNFFVIS